MFYPICDVQLSGVTVVVPSISVGNVPQLAVDLLINAIKPIFVGHIYHDVLVPIVGTNAYEENLNQLSSSCEVYFHAANKLIFLQMRGAVAAGCEKSFSKDLIDWMISFNAKRLIPLISVAAEVRTDKDLEGSQIRYALPSNLKEEFEGKFMDLGWSEYEVSMDDEDGDSDVLGASRSETRIYAPSGGFGQQLYNIGNQRGLPSLAMMMFAYEGDNENEALALADAVKSFLGLEINEWKRPLSWGLLYGSGPPPGIY